MPSPASLRDGFFYGHPRNAFWPIMGEIFGAHKHLPPGQRGEILRSHRIALWDVLAACDRPGALDADIRDAVPNDFASFLHEHQDVNVIMFNGGEAFRLWARLVHPALNGRLRHVKYLRLPSTSPAHAQPFGKKLEAWRAALQKTSGHAIPAVKGERGKRVRDFLDQHPRASIRETTAALGEVHTFVGRQYAFWRATRTVNK